MHLYIILSFSYYLFIIIILYHVDNVNSPNVVLFFILSFNGRKCELNYNEKALKSRNFKFFRINLKANRHFHFYNTYSGIIKLTHIICIIYYVVLPSYRVIYHYIPLPQLYIYIYIYVCG